MKKVYEASVAPATDNICEFRDATQSLILWQDVYGVWHINWGLYKKMSGFEATDCEFARKLRLKVKTVGLILDDEEI